MSASLFGERFTILSFGESHGPALGVVIDGCPAGLLIDHDLLQRNLDRRRPGQSAVTTQRNESDKFEILSGVFEGKTLGTPITIIVRNEDQRSKDYDTVKAAPRAGHADDVWKNKFGHSDHRGGGRSSGRETVTRVMAGSIAQMLCEKLIPGIKVTTFSRQIGRFELTVDEMQKANFGNIEASTSRFPGSKTKDVEVLLQKAREQGESYGGVIHCRIDGAPASLGQPVFHKIKSDFTSAFMSLGATTGVTIGGGIDSINLPGTEFHKGSTDLYGGIRGGITTGDTVSMDIYFKPTSSILDIAKKGRHDPCILPRAVPVIEAMAYVVLADHLLWKRTDQI